MRCAARRRRESGVSNRVGPRASDLEARRPGLETGVSINGGNSSREPKENTVEKSMPSPRDLVKEGGIPVLRARSRVSGQVTTLFWIRRDLFEKRAFQAEQCILARGRRLSAVKKFSLSKDLWGRLQADPCLQKW